MTLRRVPSSTYRLQFNAAFTLTDAAEVVSYLRSLGVTDLYASPLLAARAGSTHGYDVVDPTRINPELGGAESFERFSAALQAHGMGLLLDFVPNHMAASPENPWWRDVLEHGRQAASAQIFDIRWDQESSGRVLVPVLGQRFGQALESGELSLGIDEDGLYVRYAAHRFPVSPATYPLVFQSVRNPTLKEIAERFARLSPDQPHAAAPSAKVDLWRLYTSDDAARQEMDALLKRVNGTPNDSGSFDALESLVAAQPYRLAFWRMAAERANYRRFFDINDLVGMRIGDPEVFLKVHGLVLRLMREGKVTGLRLDHVDGLFDPQAYLEALQRHIKAVSGLPDSAPNAYVVVEKILLEDERLPSSWPVEGTTGYDFLDAVNRLLVDAAGVREIASFYTRFTGQTEPPADTVRAQKRRILRDLFPGELEELLRALAALADDDRYGRDIARKDLADALTDVTVMLPVYRTYTVREGVSDKDKEIILGVVQAVARLDGGASPALDFVRRVLTLDCPQALSEEGRARWVRFVMRWQQVTGPVMAKGLEDTAFYVYNPLNSLNEVGSGPLRLSRLGSVEGFHRFNVARQLWPNTLNTTSTHDTKRSEDARARLNVLSEAPREWVRRVRRWSRENAAKKPTVRGAPAPSENEELLLYQTMVAGWPLDERDLPAFQDRLKTFMLKAIREAKTHTSWIAPDSEYEEALSTFIDRILDQPGSSGFVNDFRRFHKSIAYFGALNSIAQTVLKIAAPGAPDFYQGSELWEFSFADPDNRRPVDFAKRKALLDDLMRRAREYPAWMAGDLGKTWRDGRMKLYTVWKGLELRNAHPELFQQGPYAPVRAVGQGAGSVVAFLRERGQERVLAIAPRCIMRLGYARENGRLVPSAWKDTALLLPANGPRAWRHAFTGERLLAEPLEDGALLPLSAALRGFPAALLEGIAE